MCYFDVILLSDVISSIGPKISDADTLIVISGCLSRFAKHVISVQNIIGIFKCYT